MSRPRVRGRRTATAIGPATKALTVRLAGISRLRRSTGSTKAAASTPAAATRTAVRCVGEGRRERRGGRKAGRV